MMSGAPSCRQWALLQLVTHKGQKEIKQISLLKQNERLHLYGCIAIKTKDAAGNPHVVSAGVDILPMLKTQEANISKILDQIYKVCKKTGEGNIPESVKRVVRSSAMVLNITWLIDALENPAVMICTRPAICPREKTCENVDRKSLKRISWIEEIKEEILNK
jgi:hypothetical protein